MTRPTNTFLVITLLIVVGAYELINIAGNPVAAHSIDTEVASQGEPS